MSIMKKLKIIVVTFAVIFSVSACGTTNKENAAKTDQSSVSKEKSKSTSYHQPDTDALIAIVEKDPELKTMLNDAIAQGKKINPNKDKTLHKP